MVSGLWGRGEEVCGRVEESAVRDLELDGALEGAIEGAFEAGAEGLVD